MNQQQLQNCERVDFICFVSLCFEAVIDKLQQQIARIQETRNREALYRYYRRLDQTSLRDIGMHDPQNQLPVLGRYL